MPDLDSFTPVPVGARPSPGSRATSPSRGSPGRTTRARSSATSSRGPARPATSSGSGSSSSTSSSGERRTAAIELADPLDDLEKPCYDLRGLTRNYDFLTTVSRYVNELGWGNYANDHEDANGQFEQNFTYADALVSCDRAIFFRYMIHTLAQQRGLLATFMPKPFTHLTGNGCHFHMSLWRDDENVFLDEDDPRGLGLSETAYHFIGGLKAHARAYSAITAPTVNSYKRLKLGSTSSGATWSPVWISYGYNNRTQMLRIPGPGRIEDRTIDGSCNPYLAATAVLAAGLDGIERKLDPGEPNTENLYAVPHDELRGTRPRDAAREPLRGARRARARRRAPRRARSRPRRGRRSTGWSASSATSGTATTSRSAPGSSRSTSRASERPADRIWRKPDI